MPVDIDIDECSVTAYLSGEIDHHSAAELRSTIDEAVEHAYPEVLVLDFGGVTFMDSSGIGLLSGRNARIACFGGRTIVINANPRIRKLLQIAGLQDQVCIMDEI